MGFNLVCVLDFEATCEQIQGGHPHEIIEVPSVLLKYNDNINKYEKISEFQEYCHPLINPTLSKFCTELTGITQDKVDRGYNFPDTLKRHIKWLNKFIQNDDQLIFLTFGSWDLKTVIFQECKRWNIDCPEIYHRFINIKQDYKKLYRFNGGMARVLENCGLQLLGRHHSGIDDCRNITRIFQKMVSDGHHIDKFKINHVKNTVKEYSGEKSRKQIKWLRQQRKNNQYKKNQ